MCSVALKGAPYGTEPVSQQINLKIQQQQTLATMSTLQSSHVRSRPAACPKPHANDESNCQSTVRILESPEGLKALETARGGGGGWVEHLIIRFWEFSLFS